MTAYMLTLQPINVSIVCNCVDNTTNITTQNAASNR